MKSSRCLKVGFTLNDKFKFYSSEDIDEKNAHYNVIFGERSNGKTTTILEKILKNWIENKEQGAYIRRYDDEIIGNKGEQVWSSIANERDLVSKWTDGEYQTIQYYGRKWYLAKWDEKLSRYVKQSQPFCYAFGINTAESYKGTSFPGITTILYDEFISRHRYLRDEFVEFTNLLSTIIRQRDTVKVYMLGNTVNPYNPYFDEMGLHNARKMEQDTIDVYEFRTGEEEEDARVLTVAVEYTGTNERGKKSDTYFAFNNPKLSMITTGAWELPLYPHAPYPIKPMDILEVFFVKFKDELIQGNIVLKDDDLFIYFHKKTTPMKDDIKLFYSLDFSPKLNHGISLTSGFRNKLATRIGQLIHNNLVYFQDNQVGEIIRNYMSESDQVDAINR